MTSNSPLAQSVFLPKPWPLGRLLLINISQGYQLNEAVPWPLASLACASIFRASLVAQLVKNTPTVWETWVWSLGWEDLLEKGKATHSHTPVFWPGKFHGLYRSSGRRVGHDWATFTFTHFIFSWLLDTSSLGIFHLHQLVVMNLSCGLKYELRRGKDARMENNMGVWDTERLSRWC